MLMQKIIDNSKTVILILLFSSFRLFGQDNLFPQISGWNLTVEDKVYDSNNLWDIIDGAADLFLEYGFTDLHVAHFVYSANAEVKVELYRHNSPINSFGMYSQERDPAYNFIDAGVQGYLQQGVLNFLDGVYYIKLSTYQKGNEGQEALLFIAKKLHEHLKQDNSFPKTLSYFPQNRKMKNREQYVAQNFLGYSFFNSVFTAIYDSSAEYKGFIYEAASPGQVQELFSRYIKAAKGQSTPKEINDRYEINDVNNGLIVIAIYQRFLFGLVNCSSNQFSDEYFKELKANLSK